MRRVLLWLGLLLVLVIPNALIANQERQLAAGTTVYLELVPVDPRSLMQGDYMRLDYKLLQGTGEGHVTVDSRGVATAWAPTGPALQRGALEGVKSFFFEEGKGAYFQDARYAEVRLSASGQVQLVGLRTANLTKL